jgi:small-conductance mechanosensitive channel
VVGSRELTGVTIRNNGLSYIRPQYLLTFLQRDREYKSSIVRLCPDMVVPGRTLQFNSLPHGKGKLMNNIIYIVGLVVVIIAILSFFGLR